MAKRGAWWPLTEQGVQWDERGNPYYNTSDGKRDYIPPIVAAQYRNDPRMLQWAQSQGATLADSPQGITAGTSIGDRNSRPLDFQTTKTWDSEKGGYKSGFDWGDVATLGAGALVGGGAAAAINGAGSGAAAAPAAAQGASAGGAASGAGGTLAASSVPASAAMQAVPASIASQGASAGVGGAAASAGAGAAGSGIANTLTDSGKGLLDKLNSPQGLASLAALVAGLSGTGSNTNAGNTDEIRRIQAITEARMRRADPLHQVATNLAFGRLPTNYRQGVQLNNVPLPE